MNIDNLKIDIGDDSILYENYILCEHLEKIKVYENFIETVKYVKYVPSFFNNLQNNVIDVLIKYTIAKHVKTCKFTCEIIDFTLNDLYKNNLSDFTIKFSDGNEFKCLKGLLKEIPYFSTLFEDTDVQNTITLDVNSEIAIPVLKLIYNQIDIMTVENICKIIKLMDMWLMDCINVYLPFVTKHIDEIVNLLLLDDNYDDLVILVNNLKKTNFDMKEIFKHDIKNIFVFDDWQKFSDDQKIKAIELYGKYELFNESGISPDIVLASLIKMSKNDELTGLLDDIYKMMYCNNSCVNFRTLCTKNIENKDVIAVIESYYPIFTATIYTKTNIERIDDNNYNYNYNHNSCHIFVNINPLRHVIVGKEILIGNDLQLIYNEAVNRVVSIKVDDKNFHRVPYSVFENANISLENETTQIGSIWNINKYQFTI